jgi:hypothetical protein
VGGGRLGGRTSNPSIPTTTVPNAAFEEPM